MKKDIESRWVVEEGNWDKTTNSYTDRKEETFSRDVTMKIKKSKCGDILQFIGGPTGHESYYVKDLLRSDNADRAELCLCAGTINRWAACYVPWEVVINFIQEYENAYKDELNKSNIIIPVGTPIGLCDS